MHRTILLASTAFFILCIAIPELLHLKTHGLGDKTISHYLRGKYGYITDLGFLIFSAAMLYVAWTLGPTVAAVAAALLGLGVFGAMLTARAAEWLPSIAFARKAHVVAAIVALLASLVLIVVESRDPAMIILGAAYPVVTALGFAFKSRIAVIEKLAVAMIGLWLVAYALVEL